MDYHTTVNKKTIADTLDSEELRSKIEDLGDRVLGSFSSEDLSDMRLCALSAGLCAVYLLIAAKVPVREREKFYQMLQGEEHTMRRWIEQRGVSLNVEDLDTESKTIH